jgi:hypothetical protein
MTRLSSNFSNQNKRGNGMKFKQLEWIEDGMSDMKKAIGVLGFIGAICIGFSISTAAGIAAIILSWLVARKLEA